MLLYLIFFTALLCDNRFDPHLRSPCASRLFGVVDVVNQILDHGSGVGRLGTLTVVSDHGASASADNDDALLALL
jgi:hypothetical protein